MTSKTQNERHLHEIPLLHEFKSYLKCLRYAISNTVSNLKLEWNSILILGLAPVIILETHRAHGLLLLVT